jgi:hypothetical protein
MAQIDHGGGENDRGDWERRRPHADGDELRGAGKHGGAHQPNLGERQTTLGGERAPDHADRHASHHHG